MKISKSDASSLLIALTEGLQGALVASYGQIIMPSDWEEGVKASLEPEFARKLYTSLDDGGLSSLIQAHVMKRFFAAGYELPPRDQYDPLGSFTDFADALAVARAIVSRLELVPIQYELVARCCLTLSARFANSEIDIAVSDRMRIRSGSLIKKSHVTKAASAKLETVVSSYYGKDKAVEDIDSDGLYFVYKSSGVISDRYAPKPAADFLDDIRAFYGAGIAFGIFYSFAMFGSRTVILITGNEVGDGVRELVYKQQIDSDIAEASHLYTSKETDDSLKEGVELSALLQPILKMFKSGETQRLRTASIWLMRANLSSRGMDQILDSTIAIEVLLGDREASDRVGLSKLMANRCSYALGRSFAERKELFEFFSKFYKVRSDIVHSGRLKLSAQEREVVGKGAELAARILRHETDLSSE